MFIRSISIKNFRLFDDTQTFSISNLNCPDDTNDGAGLNMFVGENGCGKTTLLDALVLPLLEYKADTISLDDFYNLNSNLSVKIYSKEVYAYAGTMPRVTHRGKGFAFEAKIRARGTRTYLSSTIVSDRRFIRADGETKPEDTNPDIRLKVDSPWRGPRFSENDILYLDGNRFFQVRSGTYNPTRFDRLMEDFNYRHIKENSPIEDLDKYLADKIFGFENDFLKQALDKFEEMYGKPITLNLVNNFAPFKSAFFGLKRANKHQIALDDIGSGFGMIFTLLYSYYLSKQSGKRLILLIDEPELHLHPSILEDFSELLLSFSKDSQVFISTHSPLLVKQIMENDRALTKVLRLEDGSVVESKPRDSKLSYLSANEVNFIAFELATEEYHNELYEELKNTHASNVGIKEFDLNYFQTMKSEPPDYPWMGTANQVSLHTYIRNQIHHRAECGKASQQDLKTSIEKLRQYL